MTPPPAEKVAEPFTPPFYFEANGPRPSRVWSTDQRVVTICCNSAEARSFCDRLNAAAPSVQPGDWVLVPREPTEAMMAAGRDANDKYATEIAPCSSFRALSAWEAMLAAAPAPSVAEVSGVCAEIIAIMEEYDRQEASAHGVDTPGGLEHMGDVWRLLDSWRDQIVAARASAGSARVETIYEQTYCSSCGAEFGRGPEGFSHCDQHKGMVGKR